MMRGDEHLIRFLRDTGLVARAVLEELQEEIADTEESLYKALLRRGVMDEDDTRRALARSLQIPFVSVQPTDISSQALFKIPEAFCRTHSLFAYQMEGNDLFIAVLDLDSVAVVQTLRLPVSVVPHLTDRKTIKRGLLRYQEELKTRYAEGMAERARSIVPPESPAMADVHYSAGRLPVAQVVDGLFEYALSQGASDIHIEPRPTGLLIRYRIAGVLYDAMQLAPHAAQSIIDRVKLLAKLDLASHEAQSGRLKVGIGPESHPEHILFRVSTIPTVSETAQEKVVLHVVREKTGANGFSLELLGFHGVGLDATHQILNNHSGLVVVCGPRHSGTTTLSYALIDQMLAPTRSIVTVEETIEVSVPGATQTQAEPTKGITLTARLESALRADPDVVMVTNGTEVQNANLLAHAANNGKFILTNVRADTPREALEALSEQVDARLLASVLRGVITTRLVRKLCKTHEQTKLSRDELQELEARGARLPVVLAVLKEEGRVDAGTQWKDILFGRAKDCPECTGGYRGVVGLQEILLPSLMLREVLHQEAYDSDEVYLRSHEQLSLLEDGIYKAALGITSIEEVFEAGV